VRHAGIYDSNKKWLRLGVLEGNLDVPTFNSYEAGSRITFANCPACWQYLDTHDDERFVSRFHSSSADSCPNMEFVNAPTLAGLAAMLVASEGQPMIYYGMEQGFTGVCPPRRQIAAGTDSYYVQQACEQSGNTPTPADAFYRQDMWSSGPFRLLSLVPEVSAQAHIGATCDVPGSLPWEQVCASSPSCVLENWMLNVCRTAPNHFP
jgi:hypothetical protein